MDRGELRLQRLAMFLTVPLYFVFLFPSPEFNAYNKNDAALFLTMGVNLAESGRYTADVCPGESYGRHATWPFVFPGLLAGVVSVAGVSWVALKTVMAALAAANLLLLWHLWREDRAGRWAVVLTALSPAYFLFAHTTMTEIPFMLASTATLLTMERCRSLSGSAVAGLLAAIAFLTRGYAVVFAPAGLCFYLTRQEWPMGKRLLAAALFFAPLGCAILSWKSHTTHVMQQESLDSITSRFGDGTDLLSQSTRPISQYAREFYWWHARSAAHLAVPVVRLQALDSDWLVPLGGLVLLVGGIGWVERLVNRRGAVEFWFPFGAALTLAIGSPSPRYWLTYSPFLLYYCLSGVRVIGRYATGPRFAYPMALAALLVTASAGLAMHLSAPDELRFLNAYWREYRDAARWMRDNTPPQSVAVVAPDRPNFYVASERRAYGFESLDDVLADRNTSTEPVYVACPASDRPDESFPGKAEIYERCDDLRQSGELEAVWQGREIWLCRYRPVSEDRAWLAKESRTGTRTGRALSGRSSDR